MLKEMKLPFSAEDLLHVYTVVRSKRESGTFLEGLGMIVSTRSRGIMVACSTSKECRDAIQAVNNMQTSRSVADILVSESSRAELDMNPHRAQVWEEGVTLSSSSYTSSESSDSEEEGEEAISQLMVNRRRNRAPPLAKPELAREVEIAHSFREGYDTNVSSGKVNMGRFRTLGPKEVCLSCRPSCNSCSPHQPMSLLAPDLVLALAAQAGIESSSLEAPLKCKGKELAAAPSKKSKKKMGGTSSAYFPSSSVNAELCKPEFSRSELVSRFSRAKQVTMADSAKNHETSLALARAVMLPKDVANLAEEDSEEIRDLLMIQQVQRATAISEQMKEQSAGIKKSKQKINSLEKQAKLDSEVAEKARLELVVAVQERSLNTPNLEGGSLTVESMDPPQAYSPLVLPGFNEEEILEEEADKDPEKGP
ncbi:hypothetical protein Acr_00g0030830 [Actinidia rufa]|uniref:Uncharacterized protein n=1 Tax=Actinidia rufa TaxID=165716 RepID=A0A7J0DGT7_9ERIC|nr:hypothetical protein Acr_00g0030830 [Actinidia rufa]